MLQTRTPTADERRWMLSVAQLDCVVCRHYHGICGTPAEIHHTEGRNAPECHMKVIPLCTRHHRQPDHLRPKRWVSRHNDSKPEFVARYASEAELLAIVAQEVAKLSDNTVNEV